MLAERTEMRVPTWSLGGGGGGGWGRGGEWGVRLEWPEEGLSRVYSSWEESLRREYAHVKGRHDCGK